MPHDAPILEQAAAWAARTGDPTFADWEGFTDWLSQSPAHAEAYDRVQLAVAEAAEGQRLDPVAANDEEPAPQPSRRSWWAGAIAASLAAVLALGVWQLRDRGYSVETAPGQTRSIALESGGSIELAGGTRLKLEHGNARFAKLEQGRAMFTIQHDSAHPFTLQLGDDTLVDVGTAFDVRRDATGLTVAVSEGSVAFTPDGGRRIDLNAGSQLTHRAGSQDYTVAPVPVEQVGEWREGRLTFRAASLREIAEQLRGVTGIAYSAAPASAAATYSGSVVTAPLRSDPAALGPLLGVSVKRSPQGWVIGTP